MSLIVTCLDTETGETGTVTLEPGQFVVCCSEPAHVISDVAHRNGKNKVWIKRNREDPKANYKRPRGICRVCGTERTLNENGSVMTHNEVRVKGDHRRHLPRCPGSHQTPRGAA